MRLSLQVQLPMDDLRSDFDPPELRRSVDLSDRRPRADRRSVLVDLAPSLT